MNKEVEDTPAEAALQSQIIDLDEAIDLQKA